MYTNLAERMSQFKLREMNSSLEAEAQCKRHCMMIKGRDTDP